MEPNLNSEIIHDKIKRDPTLAKGEQTGHYLGREGEMQDRDKEEGIKPQDGQEEHGQHHPHQHHQPQPPQPRPEESRKEEARREPILVKGEQTGHCLGREEAMQAQRKNRNEMEDPILRQPTLK